MLVDLLIVLIAVTLLAIEMPPESACRFLSALEQSLWRRPAEAIWSLCALEPVAGFQWALEATDPTCRYR